MVVASSGLVRGKAVRQDSLRSVNLFMVKEKPYRNPNTRRPLQLLPMTPIIPHGVRGPGKGPGPDRDLGGEDKHDEPPDGNPGYQDVRDRDADDVMQYARDHPGGTPTETKRDSGAKHGEGEVDEGDQPASKFLRVPPLPMGMDDDETVGNKAPVTPELRIPSTSTSSRPHEMLDDTAEKEPLPRIPRVTSPEGSPTHLNAPHYAGGVNQVTEDIHPVNEEQWEMEVKPRWSGLWWGSTQLRKDNLLSGGRRDNEGD